MRLCVLPVFLAFFGTFVVAQTQPQPRPSPDQTPRTAPQPTPIPVRSSTVIDLKTSRTFDLNPVGESDRLTHRVSMMQQRIAPIYRKPTSKELAAISPDATTIRKYAAFLGGPDTGIFRLVPDMGCAVNERVISAKEECIKYSMPGAGNSYSFRTENYRLKHLSDLSLDGDELVITGIFMHAMMSEIGDQPIDGVTLQNRAVVELSAIEPITKPELVAEADAAFARGLEIEGVRFAKRMPAHVDSTYVLRSIAYRGRVVRALYGVAFNELDFDKRKDVIVAFRIVEKGDDGSYTIIWKQLSEAESPKLKLPKPPAADQNADDDAKADEIK